jgi:hypothetical protein
MGLVTNLQIAEAEEERWQEAVEWFASKHGRRPTESEMLAAWSDFELSDAGEHGWSD